MRKLANVLDEVHDWSDLQIQLNSLTNQEKGKLFEEFAKIFFLASKIGANEFENVWLLNEVPQRIKDKLGIGSDHGIDLVLQKKNKALVAVQCKFKGDENAKVSWSKDKLANLFADADKADQWLIFTNALGVDKHTELKKPGRLQIISYSDLEALDHESFQFFKKFLRGEKCQFKLRKKRQYQKNAINNAIKYFRNNDRGQLIMPCGSGKTLTSIWINQSLKSKKTIILCPTLALLRQTRIEWLSEQQAFIPYICVCSEKDVDGNDGIKLKISEIGREVTTDPKAIASFIESCSDEFLIFSTYKSSPKIADAIKLLNGFSFDLAICDEAHRTAGTGASLAKVIHDNSKIPVKKRLYMTATPRVLEDRFKKRLEDESLLADMSDPKIFGEEIFSMTFAEAIDLKILSDYKILAIGVSDQVVREKISSKFLVSDGNTLESWAKNIALDKAMDEHQASHAISFHSTIRSAKEFAQRHAKVNGNISVSHVNGTQSSKNRERFLRNDFKKSLKGLVTNARCLSEGVDVPEIDLVFFSDPRKSKIDVVQAVGRALRKKKDSKNDLSYIVIPLFHVKAEGVEEEIEISLFDNLISTVRAIGDHDERLFEKIGQIAIKGISGCGVAGEIDPSNPFGGVIEFEGLTKLLKEKIFNQFIERASRSWIVKYELLKNFYLVEDRFPIENEHYKGINLGKWKCRQVQFQNKGQLSKERYERLSSLGISWNFAEDAWQTNFDAVCDYMKKNKNKFPANEVIHKGLRIGYWCQTQRTLRRTSKKGISKERIKKLDSIGFNWEPLKDIFNKNLQDLKQFIEKEGRNPKSLANPVNDSQKNEARLAQWVTNQKNRLKNKKNSQERKLLEELGIRWISHKDAMWEEQFSVLDSFYRKNHRTPKDGELINHGKNSYSWINNQKFHWNNLPQDKKNRLKSIGVYAPLDQEEIWHEKYANLKKFINVHARFPPPSNSLYAWCGYQRQAKKKGHLSKEKMDLLNELDFPWDKKTQNFLNAFYELKGFTEKFERFPYTREDYNGVNVGLFLKTSRDSFRKGKLDARFAKFLIDLGIDFEDQETKRNREFEKNLIALENFIKKNKKRPRQNDMWNNIRVGNFLHYNVKQFNKGKLSLDKKNALEKAGVRFN